MLIKLEPSCFWKKKFFLIEGGRWNGKEKFFFLSGGEQQLERGENGGECDNRREGERGRQREYGKKEQSMEQRD
jgi:hypothetical protein